MVDQVARARLSPAISGEHLGPSLSRQPGIVRIRRLALRVVIPASELNEDSLSRAWMQAFSKALFTALAYPSGGAGPFEIFRAESMASFIASAIQDLMDGTAPTKWRYCPEFEEIFRQGGTQAALELLCLWPDHTLAILLELAQRGLLDRLLARFDELAMEHLFVVLASPGDHSPKTRSIDDLSATILSVDDLLATTLSIDDLLATATAVLAHPPEKIAALRSRSFALSLFVKAWRAGRASRSPRVVFHSLLTLAILLNEEVFWPGVQRGDLAAKRLPAGVAALLESTHTKLRESATESTPVETKPTNSMHSPRAVELLAQLSALRLELKVPTSSPISSEVRWISSECCGLFFLVGTLARLGWIPAWQQLADFQLGGVTCLTVGVALAILGKFAPAVVSLDPGLALFAGYLGDPDVVHLRRVFQEFPREVRLRILHAAMEQALIDDSASDWQSTFNLLATELVRDFASRVRGFRQATPQAVVRSFIAQPGRIRIEPNRMLVFPDTSPFHVALHISGLVAPIESVSWLEGRCLEFELGDL